ncbi:MAG: methyltransferase [Acidaminococcaceae bacterium]|jgi:tRNA1(Val) A37 N6-methylase TrmN6|nr:methyltransferase [Acidaminococcaceae bacterium]MCI2110393.1 methyltransferase [Acidaminococcaceae bacterium]
MNTKRLDSLPGCNYQIWQDAKEFSFTTDAVFLAAFPHLVTRARVLELGAGTGAISMLLAARGATHVVGVDNNPHVVDLFKESITANKLEDRVEGMCCDIRQLTNKLKAESFDLVIANPPYRIGGKRRIIATGACHEVDVTLENFFQVAAYMVKYRGRFALVQLPERFSEAVLLGQKYDLELKRLQWVHSFVSKKAWIFLAEFAKGGGPGLDVLPPLIMYNNDGTYSQDTLKYYGML